MQRQQLTCLGLLLTGLSFVFVRGAYAQAPDEATVTANTGQLSVSVKMDRDTYFPGELFEATFEVTNTTSAPLLVSEPFHNTTGCVILFLKEGDRLTSLAGPDDRCTENWQPVITLGPGETRRNVLHSYGESFWPTLTASGATPLRSGAFVLQYSYGGGASAEFRVVTPTVQVDTTARVKDVMYSDRPDGEKPHPIPAYVHVVALRWENQSYICVSQRDISNLQADPSVGKGELDAGVVPYKRISTIQEPIVSLSATADAAENLTIEWQTAAGRQGRLDYPASYVVRDAHDRARKLLLEQRNQDK